MSDTYAVKRFLEAVSVFQTLEEKLRTDLHSVDGKKIDAVLIDLRAAIPGLEGEELGRALVFKAYATLWRYMTELTEKSLLENIGKPVDSRLVEALDDARRGRNLLRAASDFKWAEATVKQLEGYMQ
jgi:hypothetical protein